jgi:hypothetical protein
MVNKTRLWRGIFGSNWKVEVCVAEEDGREAIETERLRLVSAWGVFGVFNALEAGEMRVIVSGPMWEDCGRVDGWRGLVVEKLEVVEDVLEDGL